MPFVLWELRCSDPLIDVRMFRSPSLWPVFLTAGLFGVSVLGAQAPLSTFARTDPDVYGYGLGTSGFDTSLIIGFYLIAMIVGALLFPYLARATTPRVALIIAALLVAVGYLMFLPLHDTYAQTTINMAVAGLGIGGARRRPARDRRRGRPTVADRSRHRADHLFVKTVGGAIASCVFGIALLNGAATAIDGGDATGGLAHRLCHGVARVRTHGSRGCGRTAHRAARGLHRHRPHRGERHRLTVQAPGTHRLTRAELWA